MLYKGIKELRIQDNLTKANKIIRQLSNLIYIAIIKIFFVISYI